MLAEQAARYAAKDNYHVARLGYLLGLYTDAKFLIPVRSPAGHIASLMKQHRWFSDGQRTHPRLLAYMRQTGHFEFGLDRRPMNLGDIERVRQIVQAWDAGDQVRGLAMYWDMVYGYVHRLIESHEPIRKAVRVVRFEDVCADPLVSLQAALSHCDLPEAKRISEVHARAIRATTSDAKNFTDGQRAVIWEETGRTAGLWGY
jgi:hypothetical protein